MPNPELSVLVIEETSDGTIERALRASDLEPSYLGRARTMREATELLSAEDYDIICVDLALPDAHGLATVARIRAVASDTPMIVFCDELDGPMAIQAVQVGAQDYLIKGKEGPNELARSVRYSLTAVGARASLAFLSQHDPVTGLVNRAIFDDRLQHAIVRAVRHSSTLAVLAIDINRFSEINERVGSEAADSLLKQAGHRMRSFIRKMDTLTRSHADLYLLIAEDVRSEEGASVVARKITEAFAEPFDASGTPVSLTVSIGMALYPSEATDADSLLADAAAALARAKAEEGS